MDAVIETPHTPVAVVVPYRIWPAIGFAVAACAIIVAAMFLVGIVMGVVLVVSGQSGPAAMKAHLGAIATWSMLFGYVAAAPFALWAVHRLARARLRDVLVAAPWRDILAWGVGCGVLACVVSATLGTLLQHFVSPHLPALVPKEQTNVAQLHAMAKSSFLWSIAVVTGILGAPLVEECIFRGLLFRAILERSNFWLAALISGAIFAVGHFTKAFFLPLMVAGVMFAFVYARTKSLGTSMIAHAVFNAMAFGLATLIHT